MNCRFSNRLGQACAIAAVGWFALTSLAFALPSEAPPPSLAAARSLRERGLFDEAVAEYCRMPLSCGEHKAAKLELEQMLRERFPGRIELDWYERLPLDWSKQIAAAGESGQPEPIAVIVQPAAYLPIRSARDPASGTAFSSSAYVYAEKGEDFPLLFSVFAQGPATARAVAERAFRLVWAARQSGLIVSPRCLRLWVSETDEPSGTTVDGDIRLCCEEADVGTFGFYRVLAHEMGHAQIGQVGGFREPEPCAEGYLGEALFLACEGAFAAEDTNAQSDLSREAELRASHLVREFAEHAGEPLSDDIGGIRVLCGAAIALLRLDRGEEIRSAWGGAGRIAKDALLRGFLRKIPSTTESSRGFPPFDAELRRGG